MSTKSNQLRSVALTMILVLSLFSTIPVAGTAQTAGNAPVAVELSPAQSQIQPSNDTTYEIVATNISNGVGAYIVNITLSNASVGTIISAEQNISVANTLTDIQISQNGKK